MLRRALEGKRKTECQEPKSIRCDMEVIPDCQIKLLILPVNTCVLFVCQFSEPVWLTQQQLQAYMSTHALDLL